MDWFNSPTMDAAGAHPVSQGFSKFHAMLLDICFGLYHPDEDQIEPVSADFLSRHDLEKLAYMTLVEFAASVKKERSGAREESHVETKPKPYDVFVMTTSFGSQAANISVVLPMKGGQLLWWNGQAGFASLDSGHHMYRIASLSGTARVLECLYRAMQEAPIPGSLSGCAMRRELLVDIDNNSSPGNPPESSATNINQPNPCLQTPWQHRELLIGIDNDSAPNIPSKSSFMKSFIGLQTPWQRRELLDGIDNDLFRELLDGIDNDSAPNIPSKSSFMKSFNQSLFGSARASVVSARPSVGSATPSVGCSHPLVDPSILNPLNESQQQAVLTAASTKFQDGFFAIQGEIFATKYSDF
jgi:hypothetical protein